MNSLPQFLLYAVYLGSLLALVAMGLTIILGVLDIADFAQGALYMMGAFAAYYATAAFGLNFFVALPLALVVGSLIAMGNYLAVYRPLRRFSGITTFIAALGLLLILENVALYVFGSNFKLVEAPFRGGLRFMGASLSYYQIFLVGAVTVMVLATWVFLRRTRLGRSLRALSQNRRGGLIVGLDAFRIELTAFAVAGALAGLAGALASAVNAFDPSVAATVVIKAFAIVIFGGMGSVPGAIVGALLVGLAETLTTAYISTAYADLSAFVLMIAVLLVRPRGLFGPADAKL